MEKTAFGNDPRELITQYRESEWRSTRLKILRKLGDFQDARSFHFLTRIVRNPDDLAERQLAISAIARRKNGVARSFLRQFYPHAPETLKSVTSHALGVVQEWNSVERLLADWEVALRKQDQDWLRNIILSLGELKAFSALPKIIDFFRSPDFSLSDELLFAGLFSLGKLSKHPTEIQMAMDRHELRLSENGLLFQVFQTALTQVQIRSQFKLEDYLNKIFTLSDPHPVLPLELRSFDPEDVELGLSLFSIEQDWKRFLFALRGLAVDRRDGFLLKIARFLVSEGSAENLAFFFEALKELGVSKESHQQLEQELNPSSLPSETRLKWLAVDGSYEKAASEFLKGPDEELGIRWVNGWNEDLNGKILEEDRAEIAAKVNAWLQAEPMPAVYARLIRAAAELNLELSTVTKNFETLFKKPQLRQSILLYLEQYPALIAPAVLARALSSLSAAESEALGLRIPAVLEVYASEGHWTKELEVHLKPYLEHFKTDFRMAAIRVLGSAKLNEDYLVKQLNREEERLVVHAIIALRAFESSATASEALIPLLLSSSEVIRGRTLDALCTHQSLKAKQAVMEHLQRNALDEECVDKVYRCFDPQRKGGEGFVRTVEEVLKRHPDHPQWEKLVSLRDRLLSDMKTGSVETMSAQSQEALKGIDQKLIELIPLFTKLDPAIQSALRAAEQPFYQAQDLQNLPVDKAPTVLEYCKALDLILERHLGQKFLFPRLDQKLHDFQALWHHLGFSEDYPPADRVLQLLGLKGKVTPENFPLHKSKMMCNTFFNGKITQDRFKVFDGLRAWAVIFLLFCRKIPQYQNTPLLPLTKTNAADMDEKCISIAKRLMTLQDLRNPAAHRQTYLELALVKDVRNESIVLVNMVLDFVL